MKHKLLYYLTFALLTAFTPAFSQANWPKVITTSDGGKISVYEPQPETLSGNTLTGRAAVSFRKNATDEPVFGAVFFTAALLNSQSSTITRMETFDVTQSKFSGIEDQDEVNNITALLEKNAPGWELGMTKKELQDAVKQESGELDGNAFNNAAPNILYANKPTTLVVLDGTPKIVQDKNLDAEKIANSPQLIFKDDGKWNLYVGGNWYQSTSITDGWKQNTNLSAKVSSVNTEIKKQEKENNDGTTPTDPKVTDIIVATEPTELLQTDGEPEFKTLSGTSLLYVSNSPNEIFKDINTQKSYILIAGRWYSSAGMKGPWTYIPSDNLPEDFAKIPSGSDKADVLSNVAGTDAADEARMDAAVPQTAKVDRRTATINVEYDGNPVFNYIEGTSLQLAENANLTVMIDPSGNYFALDNGVWFISNDPYGPWSVANDRPRDIDDIPASSPAYHTKYVYVYDETPDYVYTGYTSGYLGSYMYGPTIVYGTGFHYRPWFRSVYYPRPITWGFGFMYDPWNGWNINWGYNYGFLYVGFDYGGAYGYGSGYGYNYGGGWFGPQRYCPPYRRPYYGGGYYARNGSYRNQRDYYSGGSRPEGRRPLANNNTPNAPRQNRPRNLSGWTRNDNLYNNQRGVVSSPVVRNRIGNRLPSRTGTSPVINNSNGNSNRVADNNNLRTQRNENPRQGVIRNNNGDAPTTARPTPGRRPTLNNNNSNPATGGNTNRLPSNTNRPPVNNDQNDNSNNAPSNNNNDNWREQRNSNPRQPVIRQPRETPSVSRPAPVERPSNNNRSSAPVERPISRPAPVERPSSRPAPVERQSNNNRSYAPVERPSNNNRPAPAQRPTISRPQSSQGGSPRPNTESHGRPNRR